MARAEAPADRNAREMRGRGRPAAGRRTAIRRWIKPAVFIACCVPILKIGYEAFLGPGLGANPIEAVLNRLGWWTLFLLLATLACTPFKILLGWTWPNRLRRMLGLFAFAYAALHFLVYVGVDQFFDWEAIAEDVTKRKFIMVGFAALLLLVPLAVTSTSRSVRKLGFARWKRLHRLLYVIAMLGVVHFVWRVKADAREPLLFATAFAVSMGVRLLPLVRRRLART